MAPSDAAALDAWHAARARVVGASEVAALFGVSPHTCVSGPTTILIAAPLALYFPQLSLALYTLVAIIWFLPDRRIERQLHPHDHP